jgi:hypothetical protein
MQVEAHTIVQERVTLTTKRVAPKKADLFPQFVGLKEVGHNVPLAQELPALIDIPQ